MISVAFETTTSNQEILCDGPLELCFGHNCDLTQALFAGKTEGAVYLVLGTWAYARMMYQPQICGRHCLSTFIVVT